MQLVRFGMNYNTFQLDTNVNQHRKLNKSRLYVHVAARDVFNLAASHAIINNTTPIKIIRQLLDFRVSILIFYNPVS